MLACQTSRSWFASIIFVEWAWQDVIWPLCTPAGFPVLSHGISNSQVRSHPIGYLHSGTLPVPAEFSGSLQNLAPDPTFRTPKPVKTLPNSPTSGSFQILSYPMQPSGTVQLCNPRTRLKSSINTSRSCQSLEGNRPKPSKYLSTFQYNQSILETFQYNPVTPQNPICTGIPAYPNPLQNLYGF